MLDPSLEKPVKDILDLLLIRISDLDTNVRWSSSKGIARIVKILPNSSYSKEITQKLIHLFDDETNDSSWHGCCLCIAELALRGLILPEFLKDIMPCIQGALLYDSSDPGHRIGSHVRDAACYVCWAFSRAYHPTILRPFMAETSKLMIIVSVFDREINCRRAASAAFQENVGRQGLESFPNGIEILTIADYYSIGNRQNSFMNIAPEIAKYSHYTSSIIDHLYQKVIYHFDIEMRVLASKSLFNLALASPQYFIDKVLPELFNYSLKRDPIIKHGSILAISEIMLSLFTKNHALNEPTLTYIKKFIEKIEENKGYNGSNGILVREATCRFIEAMSLSKISLTCDEIRRHLQSIEDAIKSPVDSTQLVGILTFRSFALYYFDFLEKSEVERIILGYITGFKEDSSTNISRGYSLLLGALPSKHIEVISVQRMIVDSLIEATKLEGNNMKDVESRRNCIEALGEIGSKIINLDSEIAKMIFYGVLDGTNDYSTDKRGDVGSWIRKAAIISLEKLLISWNGNNEIKINKYNNGIKFYSKIYGRGKVLSNQENVVKVLFSEESSGNRIFPYGAGELERAEIFEIEDRKNEIEIKSECNENRKRYLTDNIILKVTESVKKQVNNI